MNATDVGGATPSPSQDQQQNILTSTSEALHIDNQYDDEQITVAVQLKNEHDSIANAQLLQYDSKPMETDSDTLSLPSRKRKRAASPPWQFQVAATTTIKTSDGRRSSARVNTSVSNTPGPSEPESQGRAHSRATSTRLPSPPWKEFRADGPTSLQVDGKRKSGRVNKELSDTPKRVSPRSKKQVDKLADNNTSVNRSTAQTTLQGSQRDGRRRIPSASAGFAKEKVDELKTQIEDLKTRKMRRGNAAEHDEEESINVSHQRKAPRMFEQSARPQPRIKLRFNSPRNAVLPPHPHAATPIPLHPPQPSLWQLIEEHELKEMQQPYSENERGPPSREEFDRRHTKAAEQEGAMRRRLVEAGKPGGALSEEKCSIYEDAQAQAEPAKQYGHADHLVSHAMWFRQLQLKEDSWHRAQAKKIASEAVEHVKKKRGPTEDDLRAEADKMFKLIAKQVVVDLKAKWELVRLHVDDKRRVKYEAEQEIRRKEKLKKQLKWSQAMVARQRGEIGSDGVPSDQGDSDSTDDNEDSEAEDDDSDENMTTESSEDELPEKDEGLDDAALQAYLAQREVEPPDKKSRLAELLDDASATGEADKETEADLAEPVIRQAMEAPEVQESNTVKDSGISQGQTTTAALISPVSEDKDDLSSDESVDMDSEDYDSDEDMSGSDDSGSEGGQSASSEDLAPRSGLLGFFSKSDLRAQGLPTPVTSAEGDHIAEREIDNMEDVRTVEGAAETTVSMDIPEMTEMIEASDEIKVNKSHLSIVQNASRPDTPASQARSEASRQLVPQPTLLRGTLRSYQHAGLDWLASLYRNETNGILADEMGLGKTIQTISLFAHIAEQHNVWDTHLVIVPTSVILNWVTEFQKFLPGFRVLGYYGSTEERHAKRRGWVNDPHHELKEKRGYNVIVTSYNIALKDINAIRHVQWHYMVLDEAHNIRNFNSQRFQNLIKLKTRARLLLTGTPLQNSLTELWSLLTFLTAGRDDNEEAAHGGLEEFLARWKEPVNEIFERGVQALSEEASKVVGQLHTSLRPFMLRRLKADVEKDLPKKTEHVVVCKLSKRQRQLYQDYMGLSDTRSKLTQGNAISAGKVLLSLRRVCNHPDLFDPRPIQTSFAMERSPLEPYAAREAAIRRLLGVRQAAPHMMRLDILESDRRYRKSRAKQLSGIPGLRKQVESLKRDVENRSADATTIAGCQAMLRVQRRQKHLQQLRESIAYSEVYFSTRPVYGSDLRELLTVRATRKSFGCAVTGRLEIATIDSTITPTILARSEACFDKLVAQSSTIQQSFQSMQMRADTMQDVIVRFAFCTPEVTSPVLGFEMNGRTQSILLANAAYPEQADPFHEARIRSSIVFPDSRLLVYDAGKLQRLTLLLRELQAKGSRSLIFTQMSGTLNILEQFLSLMGLPYLRLDGSTSVERRALYAAEFNRADSKYQCMILSSRAGGVGLNLTGASSVIFYDLDWNPQMDKQCMDRAHRIGQVRDVEVYKMVSEKTVEENILRRANQKSLLDQTVIQDGNFTTDHGRDREAASDDVAAAIDRFLSGGDKAVTKTIESVEDQEDVLAAQTARKEEMQDEEDFAEHSSKGPSVPPTPGLVNAEAEIDLEGHIDSWMINFWEEALKYVPYKPPVVVQRDPGHRKKRRR